MQNLFFETTLELSLQSNNDYIEEEIKSTLGKLLEQIDKCLLDFPIDEDISDTLKTGMLKSIMATIKPNIRANYIQLEQIKEDEDIYDNDNEDTINDAWNTAKGIHCWSK